MKEKILVFVALIITFVIGFMAGEIVLIKTQKLSLIVNKVIDRSLDKYTIPNLSDSKFSNSNLQFSITKVIKDYPEFTSSEFVMEANLNLDRKTMNKVSGLINIPKNIPEKGLPLVVMIRGYVDPKDYFIGNGAINASLFFAKNGFITISPDFLGYGDSGKEPENVFEARFQTYTTVMTLLDVINNKNIQGWDQKNIFIWAHSNGGNIALTSLEVTGVTYPTVLWAPVSATFPYSILYYSDEAPDTGKSLRKALSQFEDVYDSDLYSLQNYLNKIQAKIQLDQGTADDSVPVTWSDSLIKTLKENGLKPNYNVYQGADHMMTPLWNTVIEKDLEFFKENLR